MEEWHDLFVAAAGAAAALTGLIFVSLSINLTRILSTTTLPARALLSIIFLLAILLISFGVLIPGQSLFRLGIEVLIVCICCWIFAVRVDRTSLKNSDKQFRKLTIINTVFNQIVILPYFISCILLLKNDASGFYWITLGFVFSFVKSISDSWVLLVEINR